MKKSTAVKVLAVILLAAVLLAAASAMSAAQSYSQCASRIIGSAPPTDSQPPDMFRDLSRNLWGSRDVFLARRLPEECKNEGGGVLSKLGSQLFASLAIKRGLSVEERQTLSGILIPAHGGRGLTHSAQTEWGRLPASLSEEEMAWLFVVGQNPENCSKQGTGSESERRACEDLYQSLLARLPGAQSSNGG
jgi:hypothetical protein